MKIGRSEPLFGNALNVFVLYGHVPDAGGETTGKDEPESAPPYVNVTEPLSAVPRAAPGEPTTTHTVVPAATGKEIEKQLVAGYHDASRSSEGAFTSPVMPTLPP